MSPHSTHSTSARQVELHANAQPNAQRQRSGSAQPASLGQAQLPSARERNLGSPRTPTRQHTRRETTPPESLWRCDPARAHTPHTQDQGWCRYHDRYTHTHTHTHTHSYTHTHCMQRDETRELERETPASCASLCTSRAMSAHSSQSTSMSHDAVLAITHHMQATQTQRGPKA
jgi:hypothetical protein